MDLNVPTPTPEEIGFASKPMPKIIAVRKDGAVTIILGNKHFVKTGENANDIYRAAMAYSMSKSESDLDILENLIFPHKKYLRNGDFTEGENGQLFFRDTNYPIPVTLADELFEFMDNGWPIESLKKFWFRCMLNPSQHGRDGMFKFCKDYGVTITSNGYAVLYKAVTTKVLVPTELDLAAVVGEAYISSIRKGSDPSQLLVIEKRSGGMSSFHETIVPKKSYSIISAGEDFVGEVLGTLQDIFDKLPELTKSRPTTVYTDYHTQTMDISLGIPVVKERSECDPDITKGCSYGLHVGSYSYVSTFGHKGDPVFACLVDPANVVALPDHDNSKIRVCDYLPYALMDRKEDGSWEEIESGYFESTYEAHDAITLEARFKELTEKIDGGETTGYSPLDISAMKNTLAVVSTRLQELSHVDTSVVAHVVQAPSDPTEFDQNNPQRPANTAPSSNYKEDNGGFGAYDDPRVLGYGVEYDEYNRQIRSEEDFKLYWLNQIAVGNTTAGLHAFADMCDDDMEAYMVCPDLL